MKYIYSFCEGDASMRDLLGGKGANLAEMTKLGLPVPGGFTVTTESCNYFLKNEGHPVGFFEELKEKLAELEKSMGRKFGDSENPLLVSVRSGAKVSMPGMMDTVLNLGLNDSTIQGLIAQTGNERFCYDAYRRFIQMFGDVVLGVSHDKFEEALSALKEKKGVTLDTELEAGDLKELTLTFKAIIEEEHEFPEDPMEQLRLSIEAVFSSWNNKRARTYRNLHGVPHNIGTAVNIQVMVFGNMGEDSGTGVAFTRCPSTGEKKFYGEFLMNAQGEDVVAGIRTPKCLSEMERDLPEIYKELCGFKDLLEKHYKEMQDLEFTIEKGKLYILQTRSGKRTAHAAIKIATDMVSEELIDKNEALKRIDPNQLKQLLHFSIDPNAEYEVLAKGLPASPGAATGRVVFTADDACEWTERGEKVILVRKETSPEDIHGMNAALGILTSTGGNTSHAAVVCRGMGKCCIAGAGDITVNKKDKKFIASALGTQVLEGDVITLNGTTGEVILGEVPVSEPELSEDFEVLMGWADSVRRLKVRANADTPEDAKLAREFGAEGIGLCRTEHMFFGEGRIDLMREMILSKDDPDRRRAALLKLLPVQKEDFMAIFESMEGLPVTIRLLDPPLHEFLPETDQRGKTEKLAGELGLSFEELKDVIENLHEVNPMLGHRGCRLGVTCPELYEMQVRAILTAGIDCRKRGVAVRPEIEVPLVGGISELQVIKKIIAGVAFELRDEINFEYKVGTMIEIPRACLTADEIAKEADFFSFGTNDLTQMVYGFSRDDVGKFLPKYLEDGIITEDPTATIDREGVGSLMKTCVQLGRKIKPGLEIGICGEHGGEPKSVKFCHELGLDYVSCSPYRVPIARLAAAQAVLADG
ncbi:MAG: pyruvate, phosphate dikinase [Patescibacteria group bacterium]|nr:pyruvate, phosphate dikinase [Patescibacteria group bacterium]